ncbi:MAG TPA: Ig-like domain-containing protein [Rhodocyclaceae bacterium]
MSVVNGTSGNDTFTPGQFDLLVNYNGSGGSDKLFVTANTAKSQYSITQHGSDIWVDSVSAASGVHWVLNNVEEINFAIGGIVDLTALFPTATFSSAAPDNSGSNTGNTGSTTPSTPPADTTPPNAISFSPAGQSSSVDVGSNIVITFNESIKLGTGSIILRNAAGTVVESYDPAASSHPNLSISGTALTIDPSSALDFSATYSVELSAGSIQDLAGNAYAGSSGYQFTTAALPVLSGTKASDTLNDNGLPRQLVGGLGNDVYLVGNAADLVVENANQGIDTVKSSVSFTLPANVEKLILTGSADINATGNDANNILSGNSGANILNGMAGTDTLIGGGGNDVYVVDLIKQGTVAKLQDQVVEAANGGTDTLQLQSATLNLVVATTLTIPVNVENLDASNTGSTLLNLNGNGLSNTLTGNAAANVLNGGAGKGTADSLIGGGGDDTYVVNSVNDKVIEQSGGGTDLVRVNLATAGSTYMLADNVENGRVVSTAAINLTGNALDNTLIGNAAANTLDGGGGHDTLTGGAGRDLFVFHALPGSDNSVVVTDFLHHGDHVDLDPAVFGALFNADGSLKAAEFSSGTSLAAAQAGNSAAHLLYDAKTGNLYFDADAGGATAAVQIAQFGLTVHSALDALDFHHY